MEKYTNEQYRKVAVLAAELKVIEAQLELAFCKANGDKEMPEEVVQTVFDLTFPVRQAVREIDEFVKEGGDIYND